MTELAKTRADLLETFEALRSDAAQIELLAQRFCYSDPAYDEDYKIERWFRIRVAEIKRIRCDVAELASQLETELSRRAG